MIDKIEDKYKVMIVLLVLGLFLFFAIKTIFMLGANYSCVQSNGTLFNGENGLRCIDINHVDICRDYDTNQINKKKFNLNYTIDIGDFDYKN